MATIDNYKIVMDVQGQQAVDRLGKSLGGLGSIIAGIGFGAFVAGAIQAADAMGDVADATGIAVGQVGALADSLKMAGGDVKDVGKLLTTFYVNIEQAASGSEKAQDALGKVGIKLNDLTTLSSGQLLTQAIKQLAEMDAGANRTAAGIDIFGKAFRNIDPKKLQEVLDTKDINKFQAELQKAGEIMDALDANFATLQKAVLTSLTPLIGATDDFRLSLEQAETIIKTLGIVFAAMFAAKTVGIIIEVVSAIRLLTTALKGTVIVQTALTALSGPRGWAIIAGGAAAAAAAVYGLNKALEGTNDEMKEATGVTPGAPAPASKPAVAKASLYTKEELKAREQAKIAAQQVTIQMKAQNDEANKLRSTIIDTIGLESNYANLIKSDTQVRATLAADIADLESKIATEQSKGRGTNQEVINQYRQQIDLKKQQSIESIRLNNLEFQRQQQIANFNAMVGRSFTSQQREIELQLLKDQLGTMYNVTAQEQLDYKLLQLKAEEKKKLIELEKEYVIAQAQGNSIAMNDIDKRIQAEKEFYASRRSLEVDATTEQIKARNDVRLGISKAMEQMARSMDPINLAQQATLGLFSKIDDSIRELVTTGRTSFGDLARSFGQMIVEMMLKQQVAKAASAATGFLGTLFEGLFKAEGGPVKGGQPYIVGEKGPELFVPPSAGSIIPNNKMASAAPASAMASTANNTYITNNISAIDAKSVAQLFAENRRVLFGSVQMEQKELSYGR
jgi:hypothetical protein